MSVFCPTGLNLNLCLIISGVFESIICFNEAAQRKSGSICLFSEFYQQLRQIINPTPTLRDADDVLICLTRRMKVSPYAPPGVHPLRLMRTKYWNEVWALEAGDAARQQWEVGGSIIRNLISASIDLFVLSITWCVQVNWWLFCDDGNELWLGLTPHLPDLT